MLAILTIAVAVLAWAVFDQANAVRTLQKRIEDQEGWIRGISEEVQRLPETLRDSEAMRQLVELMRRP